ncbi:MAG: sulfatase [Pirellulales bacterium]
MRQLVVLNIALVIALCCVSVSFADNPRPNILWITCEDISPNLGCYGDEYAVTPNLDRLASESTRYTAAFAPIGVCAPARSCLITGMWPTSLGSQHMRCQAVLPEYVHCFSEYLRDAGYYCTNNVKTDYNFQQRPQSWDASSRQAHWRGRADAQPFFAVFNFTSCHESQIRLPEEQYQQRTADFTDAERHDPAKAPLPPYHPDTPEVRRDWARYADMITYMDKEAGRVLDELEEDGLADETIVFFYSDHGAGMPRSKRWLYDSSTRVPLLVRFPEKYRQWAPTAAGDSTDRLVSFIDFGPTVLSLADVAIPEHMQGVAFLGEAAGPPREYVYGFRGRMDERYDMLRSVRDGRYKYIRNYMPQLPYFQHQFLEYQNEMPTMRVWQRLADEGNLTGPAATFMAMRKPAEELYDTEADPWEVHNLADDIAYHDVRHRLRGALYDWMLEIRDLGFLPEPDMRTRYGDAAPYDAVRAIRRAIRWPN